ncbi:MAG: hypothetical protein Kow0029_03560 [Candidatus Rifleibacteriota bacterium]
MTQTDDKDKKIMSGTDDIVDKGLDVYTKYNAYRPVNRKDKKHPCKDCFSCLFCSDARCEVCLRNKLQNDDQND